MGHGTSTPIERVWRITQPAKLSFNNPSVVLTADVFQFFVKCSRAIVRVRHYEKMSFAMPVCARTYQVYVRTSAAFIMSSRPSPANVDTSSAHISIQSLLLQLTAAEMVIHVTEASISRRQQSFLSWSDAILLLVDRRTCAEGILYRYQYIKNTHKFI